jgi:phi13 family phage major tail protein
MSNKIKYGLENVHYAPVTESNGVVSYGTPKHIPGAVNLTLSAAGESVQFYADNNVYYEDNTNNGYEGSLEIALIPDDFRIDILGDTVDSNGAIVENADAKPKKFALMFEFSGDSKKTRHVCYNVLPSRPDVSGSTTTNTKEPQTETLNIAVRPAIDTKDVKAKLNQGDTGYDTFFTAVYLKNAPTNTIENADDEFDKYDPADIEIDVTSTDVANAVKNVLVDGLPIAGAKLTITGVDVIIDKSVFAALDLGDHEVTIEFNKGNAVFTIVTVVDTTP